MDATKTEGQTKQHHLSCESIARSRRMLKYQLITTALVLLATLALRVDYRVTLVPLVALFLHLPFAEYGRPDGDSAN